MFTPTMRQPQDFRGHLTAAMPYYRELLWQRFEHLFPWHERCPRGGGAGAPAVAIGAKSGEIYFTSGGSESDNWAIKCAADVGASKGKKHIITSNFEHHAVLHTCEYLAKKGFDITYLKVDENGLVNPEDVKNAIREDTCLVTSNVCKQRNRNSPADSRNRRYLQGKEGAFSTQTPFRL